MICKKKFLKDISILKCFATQNFIFLIHFASIEITDNLCSKLEYITKRLNHNNRHLKQLCGSKKAVNQLGNGNPPSTPFLTDYA